MTTSIMDAAMTTADTRHAAFEWVTIKQQPTMQSANAAPCSIEIIGRSSFVDVE
ncbi:hypothetical protein ACEXQE_03545 [Herbiconiux sp. P17]|uniref:hypothetical protein n=1 Tax=Herbiconiux wuyangfengii TaxID=3342794 RepID=UPI0035BAA196